MGMRKMSSSSIYSKILLDEKQKYEQAFTNGLLEEIKQSPLKTYYGCDHDETVLQNEIERKMVREVMGLIHTGIVDMIEHARKEKAFERKFTRFDPIDFLSEYLYNSTRTGDEKLPLSKIPFVQKSL